MVWPLRRSVGLLLIAALFMGAAVAAKIDDSVIHLPTGEIVAWPQVRGRPLVLSFHALHDGCTRDAALHKLAFEYADRQVTFVDIFAGRRGPAPHCANLIQVPYVLDPTGALRAAYGGQAAPLVMFVDAQGTVRARVRPPVSQRAALRLLRLILP